MMQSECVNDAKVLYLGMVKFKQFIIEDDGRVFLVHNGNKIQQKVNAEGFVTLFYDNDFHKMKVSELLSGKVGNDKPVRISAADSSSGQVKVVRPFYPRPSMKGKNHPKVKKLQRSYKVGDKVFYTAAEAAKELNINRSNVLRQGAKNGYVWVTEGN